MHKSSNKSKDQDTEVELKSYWGFKYNCGLNKYLKRAK